MAAARATNHSLITSIMEQASIKVLINLPHFHPRAIVQRLCQVSGLDLFRSRQVGDGARQLEYAMIGARRELQLLYGGVAQNLEVRGKGRCVEYFSVLLPSPSGLEPEMWISMRSKSGRICGSQRAGLRVFGDRARRAGAGFERNAEVAAWAEITLAGSIISELEDYGLQVLP